LNRFQAPFEGGSKSPGIFDPFAVSSEPLGNPVVAYVPQLPARQGELTLGSGGPPGVIADHHQHWQPMAHGGVELHQIQSQGAVPVEDHNRSFRSSSLGPQAERQTDPHAAVGSRVESCSGSE